jgi:hypothetical protein
MAIVRNVVEKGHVRTFSTFLLVPCTPSYSYPVPLLTHTPYPLLLVPQGDPVYEVTGLLTLSDILSEIRSGDSECVTAPPSVVDGELSCRGIPLLI